MRPLNIFVAFFGMTILVIGCLVAVANYSQSIPKVAERQERQEENLTEISFDEDFKNITKDLANEISKDVLVRNPEGPKEIDSEKWIDVADPEKITDLVIGDGLKNFDAKDFESEISANQLKIISDNSPAAQVIYFRTFIDILTHNFKNIHADFTDPKLAGSDELFNAYDQSIKAFYNLEVPSQLVFFQQQELGLLISQKNIFQVLANYEKDPVKAILASQLLSKIDRQLLDLGQMVTNYIQKNNLNI